MACEVIVLPLSPNYNVASAIAGETAAQKTAREFAERTLAEKPMDGGLQAIAAIAALEFTKDPDIKLSGRHAEKFLQVNAERATWESGLGPGVFTNNKCSVDEK